MGITDTSVCLRIGMGILPVAFVLHVVGFATNNWISYTGVIDGIRMETSAGLWKFCIMSICGSWGEKEIKGSITLPAYWRVCQVFATLGVVTLIASVVLVFLCGFLFTKERHAVVYKISAFITYLAGAFISVTIITFGVKLKDISVLMYDIDVGDVISWSFGLSTAGAALTIIGAVFVMVDALRR